MRENDDGGKRSSKVDLAEAAGSTGVGAILGVGISGLVQVVRHKKTGVSYAMKTLRLGRLEDFHKASWRAVARAGAGAVAARCGAGWAVVLFWAAGLPLHPFVFSFETGPLVPARVCSGRLPCFRVGPCATHHNAPRQTQPLFLPWRFVSHAVEGNVAGRTCFFLSWGFVSGDWA